MKLKEEKIRVMYEQMDQQLQLHNGNGESIREDWRTAVNLVSRCLSHPQNRIPSMKDVLNHPFLSLKSAPRLAGEKGSVSSAFHTHTLSLSLSYSPAHS